MKPILSSSFENCHAIEALAKSGKGDLSMDVTATSFPSDPPSPAMIVAIQHAVECAKRARKGLK